MAAKAFQERLHRRSKAVVAGIAAVQRRIPEKLRIRRTRQGSGAAAKSGVVAVLRRFAFLGVGLVGLSGALLGIGWGRGGAGVNERSGGGGGEFVPVHLGGKLDQMKCAIVNFEHAQPGEDHAYDAAGGERKAAFVDQFRVAVASGVAHADENPPGADHEVHRAAHAGIDGAGDMPTGQISVSVDFHGAENGDVEVSASHHGDGGIDIEERGAGAGGCGAAFGVGYVGSGFLVLWSWAQPQDAVFHV